MSDRLDTHYWLTAYLRRCSIEGIPAHVRYSGDRSRGSVILKIAHVPTDTCRLLVEVIDPGGQQAWMIAGTDRCTHAEADAYIERARHRDPDIWILEVEDRLENHPLDGRLITVGAAR
ncbi:MAG: DUF1491 family protein [Rhodospirillaceae bacterium]|nr:DUF1491 family protein [Rhodospirillaceae bacterium]